MKYLVIGDSHFSKYNEHETDLLQSEVDRVIAEEDPDEIIILGDTHDRHDLRPMCRAKRWLVSLSKRLPVTVLVGNHEREDNTDYHTDIHHFVGMDRENLRIVAKTVRVGKHIYVPYVRNGMFQTALDSVGGVKDAKLIFAHQSFVGCGEPNAVDEWSGPVRVISGHIHNRHCLSRGKRVSVLSRGWDVYYPGSSTCSSFVDTEERYLCLVDGDKVKEVKIKAYPRRTIDFTVDFSNEDVARILTADRYTQINLIGTTEDCSAMRESDIIRDAEKRGADIRTKVFLTEEVYAEEDDTLTFEGAIMEALAPRWTPDDLTYVSAVMNGK